MRENCTYGSEGGEGGSPSRPLSGAEHYGQAWSCERLVAAGSRSHRGGALRPGMELRAPGRGWKPLPPGRSITASGDVRCAALLGAPVGAAFCRDGAPGGIEDLVALGAHPHQRHCSNCERLVAAGSRSHRRGALRPRGDIRCAVPLGVPYRVGIPCRAQEIVFNSPLLKESP